MTFDALKAFCCETECRCQNCQRTCWITGEDRMRRRWTCYGCGLINRWEPAKTEPNQAEPEPPRT
jgi:hypothetical protein